MAWCTRVNSTGPRLKVGESIVGEEGEGGEGRISILLPRRVLILKFLLAWFGA